MTPQHTALELNIQGMDCSGCAEHLASVVKRIAGVTKVTTLLADRKVVVLYDPAKTTPTKIRIDIEAAGYAIIAKGDEKAVETARAIQPPKPTAQAGRREQLHIKNMDCPTEEALIRNKLKGFPV